MKKVLLILLMLALIVIPFVSADVINPTVKTLKITNTITNINDFQDYGFVVAPNEDSGPGYSMCPIILIKEDGMIPGAYKFCRLSVYAIEKSKLNIEEIDGYEEVENRFNYNESEIDAYFKSLEPKEVIRDVPHYVTVPITSTQKEINNEYTIDLNKVIINPNNSDIERNYLIYIYIFVPLVALLIIILVILKRKK